MSDKNLVVKKEKKPLTLWRLFWKIFFIVMPLTLVTVHLVLVRTIREYGMGAGPRYFGERNHWTDWLLPFDQVGDGNTFYVGIPFGIQFTILVFVIAVIIKKKIKH